MQLYLADIRLARVELFHATQPYPWQQPSADLATARDLIERCGYGRRQHALEAADRLG